MVHVSRLDGGDDVNRLMSGEFGDVITASTEGSAMLFDPLKCIRCGMCSQKCPTGACNMSVNGFNDTFIEADKSVEFIQTKKKEVNA